MFLRFGTPRFDGVFCFCDTIVSQIKFHRNPLRFFLCGFNNSTVSIAVVTVKINKALQKTMQDCRLKGVWLSEKSGVSHQAISAFLQDRGEMKSGSLEKIISALPLEAREYFFNLLHPRPDSMQLLLEKATQEEKVEALRLIAASLGEIISTGKKNTKQALTLPHEPMPV